MPACWQWSAHEVRQHGGGTIPTDHVQRLKGLLAVNRSVPARQVMIGDEGGEPRPQRLRIVPSLDRRHERSLGGLELLVFDRIGKVVDRATPLTFRDADDALHDRQCSLAWSSRTTLCATCPR